MSALTEWRVPPANQPRASDYGFDLDRALGSIVGLHAIIPPDAFSAETLGTERAGNGVVIDDGLVLTIGYLITEAESVWLHRADGRVVAMPDEIGRVPTPASACGAGSSSHRGTTCARHRRPHRWRPRPGRTP